MYSNVYPHSAVMVSYLDIVTVPCCGVEEAGGGVGGVGGVGVWGIGMGGCVVRVVRGGGEFRVRQDWRGGV